MTDYGVWGKESSPYHEGERAIHQLFGLYDSQTDMARNIHSPEMSIEHRQFLETLEYVVMGSVDDAGRPWASMLFGDAGFASGSDSKTVSIDVEPAAGDRLINNRTAGSPVSLLGLELATRRRIRANLTVAERLETGVRLQVDQAYGNCPKYIQKRALQDGGEHRPASPVPARNFTELPPEAVALIEASDTLFVASSNPHDDQHDVGGVDVNHRGGRPGFVRVEGNTLTIPDYSGNFAFNTLGNFLVNPVGGVLFVDFETGDMLQLTGTTEILWDDDETIANFQGAKRAWTLTVEEGTFLPAATTASWEFVEFSPSSLRTGTWAETSA